MKSVNWKRGLTRAYLIGWLVWITVQSFNLYAEYSEYQAFLESNPNGQKFEPLPQLSFYPELHEVRSPGYGFVIVLTASEKYAQFQESLRWYILRTWLGPALALFLSHWVIVGFVREKAARDGNSLTAGGWFKSVLFAERHLPFFRAKRDSEKRLRRSRELSASDKRWIAILKLRMRLSKRLPNKEGGSAGGDERSGTGMPPEVLAAMVRVMAFHVEAGIREVGRVLEHEAIEQVKAQAGVSGTRHDHYFRAAWNIVKGEHPEMAPRMIEQTMVARERSSDEQVDS